MHNELPCSCKGPLSKSRKHLISFSNLFIIITKIRIHRFSSPCLEMLVTVSFQGGVLGVTCYWNLYYIGDKTQCFVISREIGLNPVSTENYTASFNVSLCFLCKEVCGTSPVPPLLHVSLSPSQGSI